MDAALRPQLKNASEIKAILKEVQISYQLSDGRDVNTLLVCLPCLEDGKSSHTDFFEAVKNGILQNYVFSCSEIENKLGLKSTQASEDIFEKALRKLSVHTAKGELGELILFTLLDVYLEAPKLLSKVSMKTSPKMPVFGADAVHGKIIDGELRIYLGESKLYKNFKGAASDAAKSIKNAKNNYENEFDLLDSYMDFPDFDKETESQILDLLNPYSSSIALEKIHSPCFIGFTQPDIIFSDEKEYEEKYTDIACDYVEDFFSKIEQNNLSTKEVTLFLLPFTCVDELVQEFVSYVGIYK